MVDPLLTKTDLGHLMTKLGHVFDDNNLLYQALTHSSLIGKDGRRDESNERQEFLGDRVLGLIIADMLLARFPHENEGDISRRHAALVRMETLARVATGLELGQYIKISRGEEQNGGRQNTSLLSDACEAVIAALYQDGGLGVAEAFIKRQWSQLIDENSIPPKDAKTELQEWVQGTGHPLPKYTEIKRDGPDHDPVFTVEVSVTGLDRVTGKGSSKQIAEQAAAAAILKNVGLDNDRQ